MNPSDTPPQSALPPVSRWARWLAVLVLCGSWSVSPEGLQAQASGDATPSSAGSGRSGGTGEVEDPKARQLYLRGDRYYAEGRYEEAVEAFFEAYRLSRRPLLLFNLANAYERLGRLEEALDALRQYMPAAPEYDREVLSRRIQSLQRRVDAADDARPPAAGAGWQDAGADSTHLSAGAMGASDFQEEDEGIPLGPVILWSAGGAALIAGGIFGVLSLSEGDKLTDDGLCMDDFCVGEAEDGLDQESLYALLADIGLGLGVLSVAGGLVWWLMESEQSEEQQQVRFDVRPTAHSVVGSLQGNF